MRLIAIGDIHGELDHLERLLKRLSPTEEDKIVLLGDYIDRGPKIPETVSYLIEFGQKFPNTVFLRGNHEQMLIDSEGGFGQDLWLYNGGSDTIRQHAQTGGLFEGHRWFFYNTTLKHKEEFDGDTYYFTHAGFDCYRSLESQWAKPDPHFFLWEREHLSPIGQAISKDKWTEGVAVFGHTPLRRPLNLSHMIGIDTGAVFGNYLTAVILGKEREFYGSQVEPVSEQVDEEPTESAKESNGEV